MMAVTKLIFLIGVFLHGVSCYTDGTLLDADRHVDNDVGIIGGHHILIENAPFMASLRLHNGTYHWCGASIIHDQFVLTAAHCILPNREYKILVGTDNVNGNGELIDVKQINVHKKYNNKTYEWDFCLIELTKPVTFSSKVAKVELATAGKLPKNTEFNVTGWGATGSSSVSPKLLQVEIPLVGRKKCKAQYVLHRHVITPRMICAGNRGHDTCQGDSGGPLTLGDIQVGVTSFGIGCGVMPGVYARVSSAREWILEKIGNRLVQ